MAPLCLVFLAPARAGHVDAYQNKEDCEWASNHIRSTMPSPQRRDPGLHLPDLAISGFRCISELVLPRLAPVTLLAGRNGVGKTTILDAIRVFAKRGDPNELGALLRRRDEFLLEPDSGSYLDWASMFADRLYALGTSLSIGPVAGDAVTLEIAFYKDDKHQPDLFSSRPESIDNDECLAITWKDTYTQYSFRRLDQLTSRPYRYSRRVADRDGIGSLRCQSVGPDPLSGNALARLWDTAVLTPNESGAIDALNLVLPSAAEGVAVVADEASGRRRVVVRLDGQHHPVPLVGLGDGAVRIFGVAVALANSQGGFLLIDDAENGIHYSRLRDYWHMILSSARKNDVQVVATTHSWDCIRAFSEALADGRNDDGLLIRLDGSGDRLEAVPYDAETLVTATRQRIEVR